VLELIRQYEPDFRDFKDTIVIIDEIQEPAEIYNRIREFTRKLESDFIVTGSYLGRILDKGFKYSAGDPDSLEIHTLDFEEFLTALDKHRLYEDMDLCGGSNAAVYQELQGIVVKDYSSNISKASVNRAVNWLYSSGIIGFAGKLPECNIMDFKAKARCYFSDIGLTNYFLTKIGCPKETAAGIINENFVYLDLKRRTVHPSEIALETPAFATLGASEIDFYVKAIQSQKTYALEVKTGKNAGKTANAAIESKRRIICCTPGAVPTAEEQAISSPSRFTGFQSLCFKMK